MHFFGDYWLNVFKPTLDVIHKNNLGININMIRKVSILSAMLLAAVGAEAAKN